MLNKLREILSAKILEPLFWRKKKYPVFRRFYGYQKLQWSESIELKKRQTKKLSSLLEHAFDVIPFYKKIKNNVDLNLIDSDPWKALSLMPIVTKSQIIGQLDEFYKDIGRGIIKNTTGGSTGQPVTFFQDGTFKADTFATTMLFYEWAGRYPGARMVKLWGAERDLVTGAYGLKQKLTDLIGNRVTLNAFKLSPDRMKEYVIELNRSRARSVEGYAESLYEFAKFIKKNGLELTPLISIISSAGTLHPHMREMIEEVFQAPVYDRYGSREAGNMAAECKHHSGLHIFGETTILEVVDNDGDPVAEGEEGEILVTNLSNYTMPLIRYQIGDRAVLGAKQCACGRPYPLLKKIVGRTGASFQTKEGGVVSPEFFIHLLGVMQNDGTIGKFQVVQKSFDHVIVRLVAADGEDISNWGNKEVSVYLIKQIMGKDCDVEIKVEKDIETTTTGKHLYTICEIDI